LKDPEGRPDVLVLGCGYAGRFVALGARRAGHSVRATVRSADRARALEAEGLEVVRSDILDAGVGAHVGEGTHVVVAFPPDGETEHRVATAIRGAEAVTFLSTTGVYAELVGKIDATTEVPAPSTDRTRRLLAAERMFLEVGATVLRCPGIYGPDRGLHVRVVRGEHRIPGDGTRCLSRIHVEDLARFVLAARHTHRHTFVVGDRSPAPHIEVVSWICETYGVPLPPFVPFESVHVSLRGDRRVDPSSALAALGVELLHESYRTGMAPEATGLVGSRGRSPLV